MNTLYKTTCFFIVVATLFFYSSAYAINWIDTSPKNQKGLTYVDVDSITLLSNPNRVAYRYKSLSETVNQANIVILCDDSQYYIDSVTIYRFDGSIIGIDDKNSELNTIMSGNFIHWMYQNYCYSK